jgi:hypothetical protein
VKTPAKKLLQVLLTLALVWITAIACILPLRPANQTPLAASSPTAPAESLPGETAPAATSSPTEGAGQPQAQSSTETAAPADGLSQPDPLDHLLGLRSIQFKLAVTLPEGASRTLDGEIDSAGNMHLKFGYDSFDLTGMPKGFDAKALPSNVEVFVVDGKAYQLDEEDPGWMTAPFDENYLPTLSQELHSLESPALWLNILPPGSIQPAGSEKVGGFAADKYVVDGEVDGQKISGTIWEEPEQDALVQAELHIPAALLSAPDQPRTGEMKITLTAKKVDVAPVTLPPAPAG